jgi:hypothetical protein
MLERHVYTRKLGPLSIHANVELSKLHTRSLRHQALHPSVVGSKFDSLTGHMSCFDLAYPSPSVPGEYTPGLHYGLTTIWKFFDTLGPGYREISIARNTSMALSRAKESSAKEGQGGNAVGRRVPICSQSTGLHVQKVDGPFVVRRFFAVTGELDRRTLIVSLSHVH